MTCPKCGSDEIRHSHHHKWIDALVSPLGRRALRCRKCRHRFYVTEGEGGLRNLKLPSRKHGTHRGRKRLRRWMIEAVIFAIMLLLFWIFLRYVTSEPPAHQEGSNLLRPGAGTSQRPKLQRGGDGVILVSADLANRWT